jgi:DNA-binding XRE family transcriptional regulator
MKTKVQAARTGKQPIDGSAPLYRTIAGKRMVLLEEREYQRLKQRADEWEPLLPEPLPDGNYPALEYLRVSIAQNILRHRRRLGLTQVELARRAGIRPETLNRIEQGKHSPSVATVDKIDRALKEAEQEETT